MQGYRYQNTIFNALTPRDAPMSPPSAPNIPTPFQPGGGGNTQSGDLTIINKLDGDVVSRVVLKNFKRTASRQFGDTSRWSDIS